MYTICKKAVLHCQITPLFTNFKPKKQYCLTFIPVLGIKLILSKSHRCPHKHVVLDFQPTHRCLLSICLALLGDQDILLKPFFHRRIVSYRGLRQCSIKNLFFFSWFGTLAGTAQCP